MEGEREVNSNLIGLKELGKINCCILILFPGLHLRSYTLGTKLTPTQLAILEAWKQSLTSGLDAKVLAGSQKLSFSFLFLRLRTLQEPQATPTSAAPAHFWQCCYGAHPRCVVLAEESGVSLGDFRVSVSLYCVPFMSTKLSFCLSVCPG